MLVLWTETNMIEMSVAEQPADPGPETETNPQTAICGCSLRGQTGRQMPGVLLQ